MQMDQNLSVWKYVSGLLVYALRKKVMNMMKNTLSVTVGARLWYICQ